jgi:hypothetical protein
MRRQAVLSSDAAKRTPATVSSGVEPGRIAAAHHLTKNSRRTSSCLGQLQPHGNQIHLGKQA